jgi:ABC-type transporter Mla subunit MlaD
VEESGNMAETLADRVDKSYASLAKEINGLHKVEQVLLDTADGVLDTKRRLEFAVQQILLELGDSIRRQTGDLNSTLARKVDDVTFSVLANQSTALTNMTSKLESELGQVAIRKKVNHQKI